MSTATATTFGHAQDLPRVEASKVPTIIERMRAIVGAEGVLTTRVYEVPL